MGRDVESVDQPAVNLVDECDRGNEFGGARPLGLRDRKAGGDLVAWVAGQATDIKVIEVVVSKGDAIGERREIG